MVLYPRLLSSSPGFTHSQSSLNQVSLFTHVWPKIDKQILLEWSVQSQCCHPQFNIRVKSFEIDGSDTVQLLRLCRSVKNNSPLSRHLWIKIFMMMLLMMIATDIIWVLVCALHSACSTWFFTINSHNQFMSESYCCPLFHSWGIWDTERLSNLPKFHPTSESRGWDKKSV